MLNWPQTTMDTLNPNWRPARRANHARHGWRAKLGLLLSVLVIISCVGPGHTQTGQPPLSTVSPTRPLPPEGDSNSPARETRALWTWVGANARSRADVDQLLAQVDAAHLNVILFGVYLQGTAYFQPSLRRFPDADTRLTNQTKFVDLVYPDALSYLLSIRDQRRADSDPTNDFEVHAWFTVNNGGAATSSWPPESQLQPYMLNSIFPEFVVKSGRYYTWHDPRYVHPASSAVEQPRFRQYMVDLIAGLVEDYPVDGVHLDYIRVGALCFNNENLTYPDPRFNYPGCQADYQAWTLKTYGTATTLWDDTDGDRGIRDGNSGRVAAWQVHNVSLLVQGIHDAVKAVRPQAIISVASVRNVPWETPVQGQTAWAWLDQGWIDAIFPTLYLDTTQDIVDRVGNLRQAVQDETKRDRIFAGLATHNFDNPRGEDWSGRVLERVDAILRGQGPGQPLFPSGGGVALFRSEYFSDATIRALGSGPFRRPALPYWGAADAAQTAPSPSAVYSH